MKILTWEVGDLSTLFSHASLKLIRMTGLDRIIAPTCHSSEDIPYWPALRLSILFAHY